MSEKIVKALTFYNTGCIKCGTFDSKMVKIGPIPFCTPCYFREFGNNIEITADNEKYKEWLKRHKV